MHDNTSLSLQTCLAFSTTISSPQTTYIGITQNNTYSWHMDVYRQPCFRHLAVQQFHQQTMTSRRLYIHIQILRNTFRFKDIRRNRHYFVKLQMHRHARTHAHMHSCTKAHLHIHTHTVRHTHTHRERHTSHHILQCFLVCI